MAGTYQNARFIAFQLAKIWEFLLQMALTHCHDVVAQI